MAQAVFHDFSFGIVPIKKKQDGFELYIVKHKSGNYWGFPKGHKENDEMPLETATRELFEETGLEIEKVLSSKTFKESFTFFHKGKMIFKTVEYFIALVDQEAKLQLEEVLDGKWVDIHTALDHLTYDEAKNVFNQAFKELKILGMV
jgi:8-oxo-dGTP pyrophosphatase MutT (NUDIX family)